MTEDQKQSILSPEDVMKLQMAEAFPVQRVNMVTGDDGEDIPDMSYGWYTSGSPSEESRDRR